MSKCRNISEFEKNVKVKVVKMRNFLSDYLRYRDSNQTMVCIDCNRSKSYFKTELHKHTHSSQDTIF